MLNLIIRMKTGDTVAITHSGDMGSFLLQFLREGAIVTDNGVWLPRENISHIVPQVVPQVPGEMLTQIRTEGETRQ